MKVNKARAGINDLGCSKRNRKGSRCPGVALVPISLKEQAQSRVFGNLVVEGTCLTCGTITQFTFER